MKDLESHEISHIIEMAWDDQTTFKNIENIYKIKEENKNLKDYINSY